MTPKHRFICAEIPEVNGEVTLSPEESHHLARVLRLTPGESVYLVDGRGGLAVGQIVDGSGRGAKVLVKEVSRGGARSRIRLCFAIPKGPALDFLIRRGTEVGVGGFQPLGTRFSLKAREWNEARWPRVIAEVAKQCEERFWPELFPALGLAEWLAARDRTRPLIFCDETDRTATLEVKQECDLLIGAEGGFGKDERESLLSAGAVRLGLGRNRLRVETAALTGIILLKHRLGEM